MRRSFLAVGSAIVTCMLGASSFAQSAATAPATVPPVRQCYPPQYTKSGDLILPKNYRDWIFVGSPLTPNALNNGRANFPEYHNVYIEPCAYEAYKKTGIFPNGTVFYKELQLTLPAQNPDGSRTEPSGRGFFPGKLNGADVTVKDTKRFAATGGWGYFNFHHYLPLAPTATVKSKMECGFCHIAGAKRDEVWTQFYQALDEVPLPK